MAMRLNACLAMAVLTACRASGVDAEPPADPNCTTIAPASQQGGDTFTLGQLWTGVGTGIGAAGTRGGQVIAAYYDAQRRVTVTRFDPSKREACSIRLPSQFKGWDAHNSLAVAIAPDGTVHLAGNMHASPLFYARGDAGDIGSLRPAAMIGRDESQATYPRFLHDAAGNLMFMYRAGGSGNGTWLINRWMHGAWHRVGTVFADRDRTGPVSAYPSSFKTSGDGYVHVAVVWRRTPDVASNFAVTYARTRDFGTWFRADGRKITAPLSPDTMDMVERSGENAGLVNRFDLAVGGDDVPVIVYPRYAAGVDAGNAIVAARPEKAGWRIREIAVSRTVSSVAGKGALAGLPAVWIIDQQPGVARIHVSLPPRDRRRLRLDLRTLVAVPDSQADAPAPTIAPAAPKGLAAVSGRQEVVLENGVDGKVLGTLGWFAQGANGDVPRNCTKATPKACSPPASPLWWIPARRD